MIDYDHDDDDEEPDEPTPLALEIPTYEVTDAPDSEQAETDEQRLGDDGDGAAG